MHAGCCATILLIHLQNFLILPNRNPLNNNPSLLPASHSIYSAFCLKEIQTIISLSLDIFIAEVWGLGGREGQGDMGGEGEARKPCEELEALGGAKRA